ncbi:hypothetical protein ACFFWD_29445 [Bradyrhizobium erythrophlei]|uniref:hypothetical protein n=1 Tax=Bradyrhizobium erythrophlei TaxID=1437360 RepID=UPI0035EFBCC3
MVPGGVTELIWHFVAHFRIIDDIARDRLVYEDPAHEKPLDDYATKLPNFDVTPDLDEFHTAPIAPPWIEAVKDPVGDRLHLVKPLLPAPIDDDSGAAGRLPQPPISVGGGGGGGGGFRLDVVHAPGGEQTFVQIHQLNMLSETNIILAGCGTSDLSAIVTSQMMQLNVHTELVLQQMADNANHQIPTQWWIPQDNAGVTAFIQHFDKEQSEPGATPPAHSVTPGYYLNGVLQNPAPDAPHPLLGATHHHATGHGLGVWVDAGSNDVFNGAQIVDLSASAHTMIVLGNYYHTDAIFQTNSTMGGTYVTAPHGHASHVAVGHDTTTNIADFIHHPGVWSSVHATFAGPHWHVDVVHGNYYSIHTATQTNYLMNNNIVVQEGGHNHYDIVTGANQQGNIAQLFDGSIHYDLIVVAGAYHGMNVIFQNNILLNYNDVTQHMYGTDPAHSVAAGQNALLNAATIHDYGGDKFLPMNKGLDGLVSSLGNGDASLDPANGTLIPGSGGTFNVLYITGDFYDINALWQVNVVSNINLIVQLLHAPSHAALELHPNDKGTLSATVGHNSLTNYGAIVAAGPTEAYVGGHAYNDTILVQANLLPTDSKQMIVHDTNTLVPELIAFVDDKQSGEPHPHPVAHPLHHDDAMANVMH